VSISSAFNGRVSHMKVLFCQNVTREKLCKALLDKKCGHNMLMKLTPCGAISKSGDYL